ncbi:MAG: hypothetical protein Q9182_003043 [Xanthomendoza sp. 2 TL-2023]
MSSPNTTFSLEGRGLKLDAPSDTNPHTGPLSSSTTHTYINLSGNTFGAPFCSALAPLLSAQTSLTSINLADIFTSRLLSEIPPALSSLLTSLLPLQHLQTIDLSDNAFGLKTQAPLVEFLKQHIPLRHLILNNNGLGPEAGTHIADALSDLADRKTEAIQKGNKDVPNLETVVCGRNRLETGSMKAWSRTFTKHSHVKVVKMVQNGIRQPGIELLLREGLKGCEELEILDLQDNTFTHIGAEALASVLPGWKRLRELGVGDSLLGRKRGMGMLCDALGKGENQGLRALRLQYNEIDSRGIARLLKLAEEGPLPNLRRVELNGNKFAEEDKGVERLRTLLESRREDAGEEGGEGEWGLDEFSDLEEEDSDVEEEEEEAEDSEAEDEKEDEKEREKRAEGIVRDAEEEEGRNVSQKEDEAVDVLAEKMGKTEMM